MKRLSLLESEEHRQTFLVASAEKIISTPVYLQIYLMRGFSQPICLAYTFKAFLPLS